MSEKLSILVVEDDDALRDALQVTLETAGHDTQMPPTAGRRPWKP
jgi:DNA-binding NtrC family response regulator